ncbi:MAG TPA: class I SAM-dependent methyltransferase [Acidimicrobiales bacterium]|nr:class I SAM-dependent methyltransferase [Acidimicrobiales bacterium]
MSNDLRATARGLATRSYRKLGELGHRWFGDADAVAPASSPQPSPEPATPGAAGAEVVRPDPGMPPWLPLPAPTAAAQCNVCRWQGDAFAGRAHVELSVCPACGANGRDRFLHWCLTRRVELNPALRIIECSPRLGAPYRAAMATWFFYRTSDYDRRAHAGNLQLDLQAIDLPDACLDVVLCAHVLEHVPDTDKALAELRRVMAPGGHLLLQVPILQAATAPPTEPEFHGDDTPVFWRFGFDLTARLRDHGFGTTLLCTQRLIDAVEGTGNPWPDWSPEFDVPDMLSGARGVAHDLTPVADHATSDRLGIDPAYMYLTWDCVA